jgi:PAS domain S-box-containing protein
VVNTKELKNQEHYLNNIFDSLNIFAWTFEPKTLNLMATSGVERIYGIPASEFTIKKDLWKEVTHPEDFELVREMDKAMLNGINLVVEYRIVRPDGLIRWVQDRCMPVFNVKSTHPF